MKNRESEVDIQQLCKEYYVNILLFEKKDFTRCYYKFKRKYNLCSKMV